MVKEAHGGENSTSDGDNIEFGDIIIFEQALCHFESIGGSDLKVPQK